MGDFAFGTAGATVTVGTFDGVHLAHRAVLEETVRRADAARQQSVLVTFEPHPLEVVRPDRAPQLLTTPVERRAALAETGIGHMLVLRFDAAMAALPPEQFVRDDAAGARAHAGTGHRLRSRLRARPLRRRGDAAAHRRDRRASP